MGAWSRMTCPTCVSSTSSPAPTGGSLTPDPHAVAYEQVTTAEQADAAGFVGSPTILVNGTDPFANPGTPTGLACRVYLTDSGVQPAPAVEQMQAALAR